jgi:uncharacterized repeat protein (TIGR01451 family)
VRVQLSWGAATDNVGVAGYVVYRSGLPVGAVTGTFFTDHTALAGTTYLYYVRAFDAAVNLGPASPGAVVRTPGSGPTDSTPPSAPGTLSGHGNASPPSVALSWGVATDNVGVVGYKIYRGSTQIATATGTTYTDSQVAPGVSYLYSVRAYDAAGNTGAPSNAVSVQVPGGSGADLSLSGSGAPTVVSVGGNLTYTLTTTNLGPSTASGVSVALGLPYTTTYLASSSTQGTCSPGPTVVCTIGLLAPGASATMTVVVRAGSAGTITASGSASASTPDAVSGNNAVSISTTVSPGPPPPPPGSKVPSSVSIVSGTPKSGGVGDLAAADGNSYVISSLSGQAQWYGSFLGVPSTIGSLTVTYRGHASSACTRNINIWNWYYASWESLANGTAPTSDATLTLAVPGLSSDYLGIGGEVRVGVHCFRGDGGSFDLSTDLLTLQYSG